MDSSNELAGQVRQRNSIGEIPLEKPVATNGAKQYRASVCYDCLKS